VVLAGIAGLFKRLSDLPFDIGHEVFDSGKEEALGIADKAKRSMGSGCLTCPRERGRASREAEEKIIAGFKEFSPEMAAHIPPGDRRASLRWRQGCPS
jgi:hypothetical protein